MSGTPAPGTRCDPRCLWPMGGVCLAAQCPGQHATADLPAGSGGQIVFSEISAQIVVLDRSGVIVGVNDAWERSARENSADDATRRGVGINYLQVCRDAAERRADGAQEVLVGLQAVLDGRAPSFTLEYPCHSPSEQRWFLLSVSALTGPAGGAVVAHMDVTARRLAEQQARAITRLSRLQELTVALSAALTRSQATDAILQHALATLEATGGMLALLSADETRFEVAGVQGYPPEVAAACTTFRADATFPIADAVRSRQPVVLRSPAEWQARYPRAGQALLANGHAALMAMPLLIGDRALGGLSVTTSRTFDDEDLIVLRILSELCAQALERARLYDQAMHAAREAARHARQLDTIFEAIPDPIVLRDAQARVVRANHAFMERFYPSRPLPSGQPLEDIIRLFGVRRLDGTPVALADLAASIALREGRPVEREVLQRDARGVECPLIVHTAPWLAMDGTIEGVVTVMHDITDLRRAEHEAAARAQQLDAIFDAITDGLVVQDHTGRAVRTNRAFRELTGFDERQPRENLTLQQWADRYEVRDIHGEPLPEEELPHVRVLRGEVLSGGKILDAQFRGPDGRARLVSISGAPVRDAGGQSIGSVTVARDITERNRNQQRVQRALYGLVAIAEALVTAPESADPRPALDQHSAEGVQRRLAVLVSDLLESQPVLIVSLVPHSDLIRSVAIAGVEPADEQSLYLQLVGQHVGALFDDPAIVERLSTGEPVLVRGPHALPPRYGAVPDTSTVLDVPLVLNTELIGVLGLRCDAGYLLGPESKALLQGIARLATLVIERERLLRDREEAIRLRERDRLRSEFMATVSHELRTPLTAVQAGLGLLEQGASDSLRAPERALLANVGRSAQRLGQLIEDLLTFHRLESGTLEITLAPVDMCRVVVDALATMRPLLVAKKQIAVALVSVPLPLLGDQRRLEQIVLNLLANAHRHTPAGTQITISGRLEGDDVILVVEDDGPGIPADQIEHIFDRFVQAGVGSNGSGLGLAITHALVEMHGGRIWAEHRNGGGVAFSVALPGRGAA